MEFKQIKKEIIKYIKENNNGYFEKEDLHFIKEITTLNKVDNIESYLANEVTWKDLYKAEEMFYNELHYWINGGWKVFEYFYLEEVNLILIEKNKILDWEFHHLVIEKVNEKLLKEE